MPLPIALMARALLTRSVSAGGSSRAVSGINVEPFQKALEKLQKNWKGKNCPVEMQKVQEGMAGLVLARMANSLGVTSPKGSFKKTIKQGKKHIERKFKWRPIKRGFTGSGPLPRGTPAPAYKHALKSIKVNGYWHYYDRAFLYQKRGTLSIAENALAIRKKRAMKRVASSKASWFGVATKLKLPTGHFLEKSQLRLAYNSAGGKFQRQTNGWKVKTEKQKGYIVRSTSRNTLNPHVRGIKNVNASIKGALTTVSKMVKEGYLKSMNETTDFLFKSFRG